MYFHKTIVPTLGRILKLYDFPLKCLFCLPLSSVCLRLVEREEDTSAASGDSHQSHNRTRHRLAKKIVGYYSTLVGWTDIGRKIQCLSNPCPVPVQGLSKNGSCQGSVEAMSMYCLSPVRPLSSQGILGQRSDRQIQRLSKACPLKLKN